MNEKRMPLSLLNEIPLPDENAVALLLQQARQGFDRKIVVLDDDPTGIQTVHDVPVYTDWTTDTLTDALKQAGNLFFVLTNSRSFTAEETEKAHRQIARHLALAAQRAHQTFLLISRSDSTLRGHYPLETQVLREELECALPLRFDGEVIMPYFKEDGRYTIHNVHYVRIGQQLIPAGQTEFAKDTTFAYRASNLAEWCTERTQGQVAAGDVCCISLEELRRLDVDGVCRKLMQATNFGKIVVNAADDLDVAVFVAALLRAMAQGKNYLFRCAAGLVRVLGGISQRALLTAEELGVCHKGAGLIIVGSHVQKTTEQLECLLKSELPLCRCCFDVTKVFDTVALQQECDRVLAEVEEHLQLGHTTVIYTSRTVLRAQNDTPRDNLNLSVQISEAITSLIGRLSVRPAYIVAKGGITSSSIGVKGLGVRRAWAAGQIQPGIPVWKTGEESRFPGLPYVIFPGNVGAPDTLRRVVEILG